ncbi:hypothetical protein, partial [Escherichia coli]
LSYRILDSGPDGTQTTLTIERRCRDVMRIMLPLVKELAKAS